MDEHPKAGRNSADLDPEIARLMGVEGTQVTGGRPAFADLFADDIAGEKGDPEEVNLTSQSFAPISRFEGEPHGFFSNKNYYKAALAGEGEAARRVHDLLSRFLGAQDPKDRSLFRSKLVPAFWELGGCIAGRISSALPVPKLFLLRYGMLSPTLVSPEQRAMLSRILRDNETGEPVHYQDEWLLKIAQGKVNPSATDEVKQVRQDAAQKLVEKAEKRRGQRQAELALLRNKIQELEQAEESLQALVRTVMRHGMRPEYGGLKDCFSPEQKEALTQIASSLRQLGNLDKEIRDSYASLESVDRELDELNEQSSGAQAAAAVDRKTVIGEFSSLRQMAKLCVGRQGNHFPILMKSYFRADIKEIATRENVIQVMTQVEALDSGVFLRTFKGQTTRIVPYVLLLPSYGESGICWEPFERFNRASSRGRIAIPMYPKNITEAVVSALADLRWQTAKEKAQHYWMEEGLTGRYYQWFQESKQRGDVKDYFIRDYTLWITRESQATQKLDREVRGIFWRIMPFPQEIKDSLRNRGFVYNELYKKDQNISRSDGY